MAHQRTSRELIKRSCSWIKDHWGANNLDVPDDLLSQWIFDSADGHMEATGFYLGVFTFGYLQHDLVASGAPVGTRREVSTSLLIELFDRWQLKLALAELHRVTNLKVRPMPLFEFPADEKVEAWRDAV